MFSASLFLVFTLKIESFHGILYDTFSLLLDEHLRIGALPLGPVLQKILVVRIPRMMQCFSVTARRRTHLDMLQDLASTLGFRLVPGHLPERTKGVKLDPDAGVVSNVNRLRFKLVNLFSSCWPRFNGFESR